MKKSFVSIGLVTSMLVISGCTGGTTYGTGTSHEEATFKGLSNIFSLKPETTKIDYDSRPDLVMPASKNVLPTPSTQQSALSNEQWPESPEQRISKVRKAAPEPDFRTGDLPVEYLTSEKEGIAISRSGKESRKPIWAKEEQWLQDTVNDANGVSESKKAQQLKEQIAFSKGAKRKFLTEPPVEYRQPSVNAEAGDIGITDEELKARKKAEQDEDRRNPNSVSTVGSGAF